jgi:dihydropteroate synthase
MSITWQLRHRPLILDHPVVMGIVNVTPDSFSDGGQFFSASTALAQAAKLVAEGAEILDIGGESTRPQHAEPVAVDEELRRVLPVVRALAAERPDTIISVDTVKAAVAEAAIEAGAQIVNDVSGLTLDKEMVGVCAAAEAGVIIMHSRGDVTSMATYEHATYANFLDEMLDELHGRVVAAERGGIKRERIAVDPGIGFSKRAEHSLHALACLERLVAWGYPVIVGASRKRFVGQLTGDVAPARRMWGSVGAAVAAYERGANVLRVHDVGPTRQALDVVAAIRAAGGAPA